MRLRPMLVAILAVFTCFPVLTAVEANDQPAPPVREPVNQGPRGIYLYREQVQASDQQFAKALRVPGVDGMAIVLDWSAIEPHPNAYVFDTLDVQLRAEPPHHLPIELVVRAGKSVPAWLLGPSALRLAYATHKGKGGCQDVNIPPPWDRTYQTAFALMLIKTAAYLRSKNANVAVVKLTGLNATTEELRLPAETANETTHCPGGAKKDVVIWRKAGYTPEFLQEAFDGLASSFGEAFPGVPITLALIPHDAFPPIDDRGRVLKGKAKGDAESAVLGSLVKSAAHQFPNHFILQYDFLITDKPAEPTVMGLARTNNLPVAWQTNLWLGKDKKGAACGGTVEHGAVCTNDAYLKLLERGIHPAGGSGPSSLGRYIEVFSFDAVAHPDAIAKAHAEMWSGH